jgi:glycosyltransferase involved in cell wall biosynthesis
MMSLVVIIPTKNRLELLKRALESVFSQSYADWRLVVVNDGSTDDTKAYLDALSDPHVSVINFEKSRGVNAARNAAFKTLKPGEWAVPLDDDDYFLPGAFETIAGVVRAIPEHIQIIKLNTIVSPKEGNDREGGWQYEAAEQYHDSSYEEVFTGIGFNVWGEPRMVLKWTLFPHYLFNEEVNGFEGEWGILVARENVGTRWVKTQPIIHIDWRHAGAHLSDTAARHDPGSFARAHRRIFAAHKEFLAAHPQLAKARALVALKVALRALRPDLVIYFAWQYLRAIFEAPR